MLNERLARHYGVPNVRGDEIRKAALPADRVRGGILTQASVLKVTAMVRSLRRCSAASGSWIGSWADRFLSSAWRAGGRARHSWCDDHPPAVGQTSAVGSAARVIKRSIHPALPWRISTRLVAGEIIPDLGSQATWVADRRRTGQVRLRSGRRCWRSDARRSAVRRYSPVQRAAALRSAADRRQCCPEIIDLLALGRELDAADHQQLRTMLTRLESERYGLRSLVKEIAASDAFVNP